MTNYNKRLDELLSYKVLGIRVAYETQDREEALADLHQAITSLTKKLVAEAKPEINEDYYANDPIERGRKISYDEAVREFEQNLLKALEEV